MRESTVLKLVRLALQPLATTMFRNNVGAYKDDEGRFIRYGLCEGSSDLIGWTEHVVTEADVGRKVAVFTAVECKRAGGYRRELQKNFVEAVRKAGGIATFAESGSDAQEAVRSWRSRSAPALSLVPKRGCREALAVYADHEGQRGERNEK